ncbi:MAG: hypothetical protein K9K33_12450, partial [Desulfarculaceae bacterium]|nr:hypothetical protein [Desulfarculaceae bacterium]
GDTILPDITPWPTGRFMYKLTAPVLGERYPEAGQLYGLPRYLRSLKELRELGQARPGLAVLPAHRLYYQGRFNFLDLAGRVDELLKHHVERCADLLRILKDSPKNAEALARAHFEDAKLSGPGMNMAKNEVVCHCELLMDAGDVVRNADRLWEATGSGNFERFIQEI